MHADDALHADTGRFLLHIVSTSIAALFGVLGPLDNPLVPSPLGTKKFEASYNHLRRLVGRRFNSHTVTVGMLPFEVEQLQSLVAVWLAKLLGKSSYDFLELAHLLGTLENHTKHAPQARCWFFASRNAARQNLHARHEIVVWHFNKAGKEARLCRELPAVSTGASACWCHKRRPVSGGQLNNGSGFAPTCVLPWRTSNVTLSHLLICGRFHWGRSSHALPSSHLAATRVKLEGGPLP